MKMVKWMGMKNITAAQWDAIAWAQGNFGVSDSVVGKMLNCPADTVRHARLRGGWDVRDLTKAHSGLTGWRSGEGKTNNGNSKRTAGSSPAIALEQEETGRDSQIGRADFHTDDADDADDADDSDGADTGLTLERLTLALSRELNAAASGTPDAAALKRVDGLVAAAKALEKLMALKPKAADEPPAGADAQAVEEKARLLAEMDRRIDDLAEQRANEIHNGRSGAATE